MGVLVISLNVAGYELHNYNCLYWNNPHYPFILDPSSLRTNGIVLS